MCLPASFYYEFTKIRVIDLLSEVSVKHALESTSVSSLILRHLVNGVMDCVEIVLLSTLCKVELAACSTELTVNSPCKVSLGGSLHVRL